MKRIIILSIMICFGLLSWAQNNSGRGYLWQGVISDSDNNILSNKTVELQVKLYGMEGENAINYWTESHTTQTDVHGTVLLRIGRGIKVSGSANTFSDVEFSSSKADKQSISVKVGNNWHTLLDEEIASAPFAESAFKAIIPAGTISTWCGELSTIPKGWVLCDGTSRTINPEDEFFDLFQAIGRAWGGTGSGNSGTFRIPDMRGVFLRGVSGTLTASNRTDPDRNSRTYLYSGGNTGNKVGSYQADQYRSHTHSYEKRGNAMTVGDSNGANTNVFWDPNLSTSGYTSSYGGNQTNPYNLFVYYIIKY